jgi:hypothetical protein
MVSTNPGEIRGLKAFFIAANNRFLSEKPSEMNSFA